VAVNAILEKVHYRKVFYLVFGLLIALLLLVRYIALPQVDATIGSGWVFAVARVSETLLASFVVTVAIGAFVFWLTPGIMRIAPMEVIEPREIGPLLERALLTSSFWWYKGSAGRYFRAVTLPEMARAARKESLSREVNALILDPTDDRLCEEYATYRRSLKSATESDPWTKQRVKCELVATIMTVLRYQEQEPLLRIRLGLTRYLSSFRLDLSSQYVIVTKEDRDAPAMRCDKDTYFYRSYYDEIVLAHRQAREIKGGIRIPAAAELTAADVGRVLASVGMGNSGMDEEDLKGVIRMLTQPKNPYA